MEYVCGVPKKIKSLFYNNCKDNKMTNYTVDYELESCPFCESKNVFVYPYGNWGEGVEVRCRKCLARGPIGLDEKEAVAAWNTRSKKRKR